MAFTVSAGSNALYLTYDLSDGNVDLAEVSVLSAGGPKDRELYYLTNYDTEGKQLYNPAREKVVTQTTQGVTNTTAEIQSVAGFSESELSALSGKTLFFLMVQILCLLNLKRSRRTLLRSSYRYNLCFRLWRHELHSCSGDRCADATYASSDGDVELADVSILPSNSLAVTQSTKGVTGATGGGAIGCWLHVWM